MSVHGQLRTPMKKTKRKLRGEMSSQERRSHKTNKAHETTMGKPR